MPRTQWLTQSKAWEQMKWERKKRKASGVLHIFRKALLDMENHSVFNRIVCVDSHSGRSCPGSEPFSPGLVQSVKAHFSTNVFTANTAHLHHRVYIPAAWAIHSIL